MFELPVDRGIYSEEGWYQFLAFFESNIWIEHGLSKLAPFIVLLFGRQFYGSIL